MKSAVGSSPKGRWVPISNGRVGVERIIRDLKRDYALGKIPSRHFVAHEAYFHLLLPTQPGELVQAPVFA